LIGSQSSQIIKVVSDQNTDAMNGKRPFEERVFARFDSVDSAMRGLDSRLQALEVRANDTNSRLHNLEIRADDTNSRLQKLEIRAYDTKPIWEQAIKEILDTRREMSKRLDRIDAIVLENRADLRDVEDRLDKIEPKLPK
jgi:chromosome segregation ATPase